MGQHLTITAIKDTGKVDNYGNHKCYITMQGDDGVTTSDVYAAFKEVPSVGTKRYGAVQQGEYGPRFKSEQVPDGEYTPQTSSNGSGSVPGQKTSTNPSYNPDGAKQGMAVNNAAAYVNSMLKGERLSPEEYAAEVQEYAKAVYTVDPTKKTTEEEVLELMQ